jgi:Uma2 family endonuclease
MNLALRKPIALRDFLLWEEAQGRPYEFDGLEPVAMTGGTIDHDRITFNLRQSLEARLAASPCRPFGPNVKILASGSVRYPDALVACTKQAGSSTIVEAPVVVFEVVSTGTSRTDRIEKVREYQATPSILRYVILEPDSIAATVFERTGETWRGFALADDDTLRMPEIGIELPLRDCYAGVEVTERGGAAMTREA